MSVAVMAAGAVGTAAVWVLVRYRGASIWYAATGLYLVVAPLALATGWVSFSPRVRPVVAAAAGVGAGLALFLATRVFVAIAGRWEPFRRHVATVYDQRQGVALPVALVLASVVVAPGEEIVWRGLFQARIAAETSALVAALLAWAAYVAVNMVSGRLPIVAGAIVGGAAWGALAFWTRGVLAGTLCHCVWVGLMIALPPGEASR